MTQEQYETRVVALASYIKNFVDSVMESENVALTIDIRDAAESICTLYDSYTENIVRPSIISSNDKGNIIQNFKIISNTELSTLRVAPISAEGLHENQVKSYNVRLALDIAIALLIDWNEISASKAKQIIASDSEIKAFLEEHTKWLFLLDIRFQFPLFSNSQIWRLFYYLLRDRSNQI